MKIKDGTIKSENALSITDITRILEGSKNLKSALKEIGLSVKDISETRKRLYND